jgi:hypothetical protein
LVAEVGDVCTLVGVGVVQVVVPYMCVLVVVSEVAVVDAPVLEVAVVDAPVLEVAVVDAPVSEGVVGVPVSADEVDLKRIHTC